MSGSSSHPPLPPYDYYSHTQTTRQIEDARLALQGLLGIEAEWPILKQLALEGSRIHCVGAGPCFYENELFERIRPTSALVSDVDKESIEYAQAHFSDPALSFKVLDAREPYPTGFDVVVERFLLIQLSESDARLVVRQMVDALPPGGRAILVEFVNSSCVPSPMCPALLELRQVMMDRFKAHGADPDIGQRLESFLEDAGLRDVRGFDVPYIIAGNRFRQPIVIGQDDFGNPSKILGDSYAKRFESDHPQLVREFREWLEAAQQPGSAHTLEHKYRMAIGTKM